MEERLALIEAKVDQVLLMLALLIEVEPEPEPDDALGLDGNVYGAARDTNAAL